MTWRSFSSSWTVQFLLFWPSTYENHHYLVLLDVQFDSWPSAFSRLDHPVLSTSTILDGPSTLTQDHALRLKSKNGSVRCPLSCEFLEIERSFSTSRPLLIWSLESIAKLTDRRTVTIRTGFCPCFWSVNPSRRYKMAYFSWNSRIDRVKISRNWLKLDAQIIEKLALVTGIIWWIGRSIYFQKNHFQIFCQHKISAEKFKSIWSIVTRWRTCFFRIEF